MNSKVDLKLDWCSYEAAKYAVTHWHYSKSLPAGKTVKIGVWEDGQFIGAIVFSMGANKGLGNPYGLSMFECCELVRIALRGHLTPTSRIISIALKMFRKQSPGIQLCISFADPEHGHIGGIYQAGGWLYLGRSLPADEYIFQGRRIHGRQARSLGLHRSGVLKNLQVLKGSSKYRYAMPFDSKVRVRLSRFIKPYPKRATSETIDTSGDQSEEGGAAPTVALQIEKVDQARAA